jgi:DNA repair exonuclease SbcCD ATPase subunit
MVGGDEAMMRGRDQLAIIDQHILAARRDMETMHSQLETANQRLVEVRSQQAQEYRRLAEFRMDELAAGQLITQMDETDRAVLKLLERRSQTLAQLEREIEQSLAKQAQLEEKRSQVLRRRDELLKQIDQAASEIKEQLSRQDAYQKLEKSAEEVSGRAERAEKKAAQAEADREEKGKPYREDPLFMYLWKRHYLTPDYTEGGLTRMLDGWVAKMIDYAEASSNYYMLTELPVRLREHADGQKMIAAQEVQKLRDMEAKALEVEPIMENRELLRSVQKSVEESESRIEEEEKRHESLLQQRSAYSSGSDELSRQAIQLQVSEIKNDSLTNLYTQAKMTNNPDDDVIVSRIRELHEDEQELLAEVQNLQSQMEQQQKNFQKIEELKRRFRRSSYDSNHSFFPSGFQLAALLGLLMSGRASGGDVWGRIDREQQFRRPRTPIDFGGGVFPGGSGGGLGGGGFRTGGGF